MGNIYPSQNKGYNYIKCCTLSTNNYIKIYIKNIENPYFICNIFMRVGTLMFFPRGGIFYNYIYCSIYAGWTVRAFHTSPRGSTPPATLLYVFPWCIAALVFAVMHGQSSIMVTWTSGRAVGGGYYKYYSLWFRTLELIRVDLNFVWEWSMERLNLIRQNHILLVFVSLWSSLSLSATPHSTYKLYIEGFCLLNPIF